MTADRTQGFQKQRHTATDTRHSISRGKPKQLLDPQILDGITITACRSKSLIAPRSKSAACHGTVEYDDLNRLVELTHYQPDTNAVAGVPDLDLSDNPKLAQFEYALLANGSRSGVSEQFWTDGDATTSAPDLTDTYLWNYDAANRLIDEVFWTDADNTNPDGSNAPVWDPSLASLPDTSRPLSDYHDSYRFDLAGNRLARFTDLDPADPANFNVWQQGDLERDTRYAYDANDRLVTETLDFTTDGSTVDGTVDRTTTYEYDSTQQIEKAVHAGAATLNSQLSTFPTTCRAACLRRSRLSTTLPPATPRSSQRRRTNTAPTASASARQTKSRPSRIRRRRGWNSSAGPRRIS